MAIPVLMALAAAGLACTPGEEEIAEGIEEEVADGIEEETVAGIVFVRVRGGSFMMRPDWKPHPVTLSEFWIGKYEVTNEQFGIASAAAAENLPATRISWTKARDFCKRLGFRLPTEAEWEYAARAGSETLWSFGDDESLLGEHAWYYGNSGMRPHEVGTRKPNAWGIHDMHGNVREWVADWYGPYPMEAQTNPRGPSEGTRRVLRGGSFHGRPITKLSATHRFDFPPEAMLWTFGFRCARDAGRRP